MVSVFQPRKFTDGILVKQKRSFWSTLKPRVWSREHNIATFRSSRPNELPDICENSARDGLKEVQKKLCQARTMISKQSGTLKAQLSYHLKQWWGLPLQWHSAVSWDSSFIELTRWAPTSRGFYVSILAPSNQNWKSLSDKPSINATHKE